MKKAHCFVIVYVESLILMETLQPTPLYAALLISVSIRCDKIPNAIVRIYRAAAQAGHTMPHIKTRNGPRNGMDKTVRRQSSLTAWVREFLKPFLKSSLTKAHEVGGEHRARGEGERNPGSGIHLLRRLGKYVICFQSRQGLFNYFASDLFVEYEILPRRRCE
jgi:hypothetical protein